MKEESFSNIEYRYRKKTKREKFLEIMDEIIPRDEWVSLMVPAVLLESVDGHILRSRSCCGSVVLVQSV